MSDLQPLEIKTETLPNGLTFNMVKVEGGRFWMGDDEGEYSWEKPAHKIELDTFWIAQTQVKQALWEEIMQKNPSRYKGRNRPVETINWYNCIEFCNSLSEKLGYDLAYELDKYRKDPNNLSYLDDLKYWVRLIPGSNGFRMPTEAEWEFTAQGGKAKTEKLYAGSQALGKVAWYRGNSPDMSQPVGLRAPNELGLNGMTGNVWEWCWDWYDGGGYYERCFDKGVVVNPYGPESGRIRINRGGSCYSYATDCRVAYRGNGYPHRRSVDLGLRLARTAL